MNSYVVSWIPNWILGDVGNCLSDTVLNWTLEAREMTKTAH